MKRKTVVMVIIISGILLLAAFYFIGFPLFQRMGGEQNGYCFNLVGSEKEYKSIGDMECKCRKSCDKSDLLPVELYNKGIESMESYCGDPKPVLEAFNYFCQAICKDPKYAPAYSGIGEVYITLAAFVSMYEEVDKENYKRAEKWLKLAKDIAPEDPHYHYAMFRFIDNQFDMNTKEWQEAFLYHLPIAYDKLANNFRHRLANANITYLISPTEAMEEYKYALQYAHTNVEKARVYESLARFHEHYGNYKEWEENYRQAQELWPENPHLHNNFAGKLLWLGRCEEAYNEAMKALKIYEFGMALMNQKRATSCALEQSNWGPVPPEYSEAMFLWGSTKKNEGLNLLQIAVQKNKRFQAAQAQLTKYETLVLHTPGAADNGLIRAKAILKEDPESLQAQLILFYAYWTLDKYDKALEALLAVEKKMPEHYDEIYIRNRIVDCYLKLKQPQKAIEQYRLLIKFAPLYTAFYEEKIRKVAMGDY